jgi:type VI secretion system protein ImpH
MMQENEVVRVLVEEPHQFSLTQAISLLEKLQPERPKIGYFDEPSKEAIRLKSSCSLMFPAAQIDGVVESLHENGPHYEITTSLLGLFGVLSPLPVVYTSQLISSDEEQQESNQRVTDFLDLFNHRLLSLLYRVETAPDTLLESPSSQPSDLAHACLALMGRLHSANVEVFQDWRFRSLSNNRVLTTPAMSVSDLQVWLKTYFPDVVMSASEFTPVPIRIPTEDMVSLGVANSHLSCQDDPDIRAASIGSWVLDCETVFTVHTGPLSWPEYLSFLPGGDAHSDLVELLKLFTPLWLSFHIELTLRGDDCHHLQTRLDSTSALGLTTGLFESGREYRDMTLGLPSSGSCAGVGFS